MIRVSMIVISNFFGSLLNVGAKISMSSGVNQQIPPAIKRDAKTSKIKSDHKRFRLTFLFSR